MVLGILVNTKQGKEERRGELMRGKNVQTRREESKSFLFAADKTSHAENPEHSSKNPWNY